MRTFLFALVTVFLFHFPSHTCSLVPLCKHHEASALLAFINSFHITSPSSLWPPELCEASHPKTESWQNGTNCCLWDGVTCHTTSGHVVALDLSCGGLEGPFHPNNTLFQLTHLHSLNLAFNIFMESPMPSGFGDLMALTHLNLSLSGFTGLIPSKISHLSKLVSLDLSKTKTISHGQRAIEYDSGGEMRFKGSTFEKLIGNLTDLRELVLDSLNMSSIHPTSLSLLLNSSSSFLSLSLHDCELYGTLPSTVLRLPNLQYLDLNGNWELAGELPKFNWSTSLRYLDLSRTAFQGTVPKSISHLKSLNYLSFEHTFFEGPVLQFLSNLTQLNHLNLGSNAFGGEVPLSLSNLQNLIYMDLSYNHFEGPVPLCLRNITQLNYLSLRWNNFSGEIPSFFSNLQHLTFLDLSQNSLEGSIPDMSGLSNLMHLHLYDNLLNGSIPLWCFSSSSLLELSLASNQFTGPMGNFTVFSLEYCDLSDNKLQGSIPKSLFDLQNLSSLFLSSNNLSGLVPFHKFSELQYLTSLDLSHNNHLFLNFHNGSDYTFSSLFELFLSSCNINKFPKFLKRLKHLQSLDLSNNQIHGRIPKWFNNTGKDTLAYLDLSRNLLTSVGDLSLSWKGIPFIDLSFNSLEGDIPLPPFSIEFFSVSNNKLTGEIPLRICKASSIVVLNLSHNNLTGKLPQCLGVLPDLSILDLQRNNLSGTIPRTYFGIKALQTMNFNGNRLKGPLPRHMAKCRELRVLDLGENHIQDTFPSWLESLEELQVLVLRDNNFHGTIINSLKLNNTFPKLRIFDISNNNFTGPLPTAYLRNFKGMMSVDGGLHYLKGNGTTSYSQRYNDSVVVTMKGNIYELDRILTTLATIDLSNNKFEGKIPEVIGELKSLIGLNLSHNKITGLIPQSFRSLENLEWLDLSSNMLVGEIPEALTNLRFLSSLNLSQNHLEGMIPTGKQFDTFQIDSYLGNPGLCGFPLLKSCHEGEKLPKDSSRNHEEKFGFGWRVVAIGYACGVIFGMLLGFLVFLIGKPLWIINLVEDVSNSRMREKIYKSVVNLRLLNGV